MKLIPIRDDSFESYFSVDKVRFIHDISPEVPFSGKPGFVHFAYIDDHLVGFLGLGKKGPDKIRKCRGKVYRSFRMLLPKKFHMVDVDALYDKVKGGGKEKIEIKGKDLIKNPCSTDILLDICTCVRNPGPSAGELSLGTSLHPCGEGEFTGDGDWICFAHVLSIKGTKQRTKGSAQNSSVTHDPVIFYVKKKDLEKKAKDKLKGLFPELKEAHGVFVIPTEIPGKGINYFCLPNVDAYKMPREEVGIPKDRIYTKWVKNILKEWIQKVRAYDSDNSKKVFFGAIDDIPLPLDSLSISVNRFSRVVNEDPT